MIIFKLGIINTTEYKYEKVENETLDIAVIRILQKHFGDRYIVDLDKMFCATVNGVLVDRELWHMTSIKEEDQVIVFPDIKGGSFGQTFKTAAIIAVAIIATVVTRNPSLGLHVAAQAAIVAGATIGATLALNALIPPPGGGSNLSGLSYGNSNFTESQTYTLERQSNNTKRFGKVPKSYGRNKMFPLIAANPYTTLETYNGEVVQYFYCIYDFGLGPMEISDIRIGDTPLVGELDGNGNLIPTFGDVQYNLVDLNKPAVSTGPWDGVLQDSFSLYKGDVETDDQSYSLNKDENVNIPSTEWRVIRNLSNNVQGDKQEIVLDFVFPNGLIGYDSNGVATNRTVTIRAEFAKVGTNDWNSPVDLTVVDNFIATGAQEIKYYSGNLVGRGVNSTSNLQPYLNPIVPWADNPPTNKAYTQSNSYYVSSSSTQLLTDQDMPVGSNVYHSNTGHYLGKIVSISDPGISDNPAYILGAANPGGFSLYNQDGSISNRKLFLYQLDKQIGMDIVVYSVIKYSSAGGWQSGPSIKTYHYTPTNQTGVFYWVSSNTNTFTFTAKTTRPYYASISFKPKDVSQYKVRITRLSSSGGSTVTVDSLSVLRFTSRFDRDPILTDKRHVFLELRIKATNQLNGALQNLSAVTQSVLDVYDENTLTWSKEPTSNPAWVYVDLLTGEVNKKAIDKSRLDLNSILDWRDFCDEVPTSPASFPDGYDYSRFSTNFILDYETTLQGVIEQVANSCQASMNIVDGKYGVLIDRQKTVPTQIFTPRNYWGFRSTRTYTESPDLLRVQFIEPSSGWRTVETNVFNTGKDLSNYETVEDIVAFACTNVEQAWRFGRYMQAQAILRQETISINVDFEYLACNRGDYVQITQDVMKVGGTPARVRSVSGTTITIDTEISTDPMETYGYVFRSVSNGITTPSALTVIDSKNFDLSGLMPSVGDLIIIGLLNQEVFHCIVKSITPSNDLSAELVLVEKADGVYDAESTGIVPTYESFLLNEIDNFAAPGPVQNLIITENSWRVVANDYQYYIDLDWDIPLTGATDTYEVYRSLDNGNFELVTVIKSSDYEYIVDHDDLDILHSFKVIAVASNGDKISLAESNTVSATPVKKVTPPSDVEGLFINITGEVLQLDWTPIPDADIYRYLLRYSPQKNSSWESSIPLVTVDGNTTSTSVQARTGRYFIKALDLNLNQSENAASAFTSIPELFNLNIIDETNDFPTLPGTRDQVVNLDVDSIILQESVSGAPSSVQYYPEGYYYYENLLDLGEIATVRLQSLVEAEGYSPLDLMANWPTLDSVTSLANTGFADWDVETQVRFSDKFNTISEWNPMSDVLSMVEGDIDNWSPWVKFTMGDFTAKIFQFRLKLISYQTNTTPRVFDGVIRADMPDRIDSYDNIISDAFADTEVVYTPAFMGPGTTPSIQITQDDMEEGDYYTFVSKSLSKMVINFYDKNNVRVSRQFDVMAKGYGRQYTSSIF